MLTEKMAPLLEKAKLPKVIFVSSGAGSMQRQLGKEAPLLPVPMYGASKAAMNFFAGWYSKKYPKWKVNAVCPGRRATAINGAELSEETHPALGAIRVEQLVKDGLDGVTGTFSNKDGPILW
jgi:NAD(P)-dependent dehydrogenase (short-subunit alcohol dehydrogenase family)